MELLFGLLQILIGLSFNIIMIVFRLVLAFVAGGIAGFKHRKGVLWGIATLVFPWVILIIIFMPKKYPKFTNSINKHEAFKGKNPVIASIMALAAIVAKADGSITKEEVAFLKKFITHYFGVRGEELNSYAEAFDYGKNHPEEYQEFTRIIANFYITREMRIAIAYLLVSIAMQSGSISSIEDTQIKKILRELGISDYEYNSIKNSFTREYYNNAGSTSNQTYAQSRDTLTKKHSDVLGVSTDATMSEIKKAYRRLVKEYHPDKLASESMPEDYVEFANQKIREINEAYEYLKSIKEI